MKQNKLYVDINEKIREIRKDLPKLTLNDLYGSQPIESEAWDGLYNLLKDGGTLVIKKKKVKE